MTQAYFISKEYDAYKRCSLCPRNCGIDRIAGERGFCDTGANLVLACVTLHKGEEPPITGETGSGAFFFSGCTLKCPFCQNYQISQCSLGREITIPDFADLCLTLQERKATNINLVTPSHLIPALAAGLRLARQRGLELPVVWNSSGYEKPETLELIDPYVSLYLPDCKTLDPVVAGDLLGRTDYPKAARETLLYMAKKGDLVFNDKGEIIKGMIVRHLVLPGVLESTRQVLEWFSANLKETALLSLLVQYLEPRVQQETVCNGRGLKASALGKPHKLPKGTIGSREYDQILLWLDQYNIDEGFLQEQAEGESCWLPDFNRSNPFPSDFSQMVWHWRDGLRA